MKQYKAKTLQNEEATMKPENETLRAPDLAALRARAKRVIEGQYPESMMAIKPSSVLWLLDERERLLAELEDVRKLQSFAKYIDRASPEKPVAEPPRGEGTVCKNHEELLIKPAPVEGEPTCPHGKKKGQQWEPCLECSQSAVEGEQDTPGQCRNARTTRQPRTGMAGRCRCRVRAADDVG